MSGHNKWSQIKHQKGANDEKKGRVFGQLAKQIALAARQGGADPEMNPALRKALDDAKEANLPKDNIQRAINKGTGIGGEAAYEPLRLEGYGPGGIAIIIEAESDNKNRTISEIRHLFKEHGGALGEPGSAAYVFGSDPNNPSFRMPVTDPADRGELDALIGDLNDHEDVLTLHSNLQD